MYGISPKRKCLEDSTHAIGHAFSGEALLQDSLRRSLIQSHFLQRPWHGISVGKPLASRPRLFSIPGFPSDLQHPYLRQLFLFDQLPEEGFFLLQRLWQQGRVPTSQTAYSRSQLSLSLRYGQPESIKCYKTIAVDTEINGHTLKLNIMSWGTNQGASSVASTSPRLPSSIGVERVCRCPAYETIYSKV